jgi:beta-galactosidase
MREKNMNRRDFLRYGGLGAVQLGLVGYPPFCRLSSLALQSNGESDGNPNTLKVRVSALNDTPRLLVNKTPVRARMFFGGPASSPIHASTEGKMVHFEFVAQSGAIGDGTMHFRFGHIPGDIYIDNIRVVDATTGAVILYSNFENGALSFTNDWITWPPGKLNTVGTVDVEPGVGVNGSAGLHVTLKSPPNGDWPDWHIYHIPNLTIIKGRTYRVSFWIRALPPRDVTVAFYLPGTQFTYLGGPPGPFEREIRLAAAANVNFISFPIPNPWFPESEKQDWSAVDSICQMILRTNPNALLIPRIGCDPPRWWIEAHPEDVMTWEDGSKGNFAVVASPTYRKDASEQLSKLIRHLEDTFGEHMAGYHPAGQNTGEWFYENTWGSLLNGYSDGEAKAWRLWLKEKYHDDKTFQTAWRSPNVTLSSVTVPSPSERRATPNGVLLDPATQRPLIDFAEFQQEAMADLVCDLAHAVQTATHGRKLALFFYGYVFEFGAVNLGPATSGHYALGRVLDCEDVDILCSPISYFDRGVTGSAPAMTAAESIGLAGKMYLMEDDTRTYIATGPSAEPLRESGANNLLETREILSRNVAQESTRNFATWWMDLGMTGWFDDPRIWDVMKQTAKMDQYFLSHPSPFHPEVAAILDEKSILATSSNAHLVTLPGIYQVRDPLARIGAPYGQYLMEDLLRGRINAKLLIILNAWLVSTSQHNDILKHTQGAACVWCYAPGCYDEHGANPEAMKRLTGFSLQPVKPGNAYATPTAVGKRLGIKTSFGVNYPIEPLFAATDAKPEEILATYPDGSAAAAMRRTSRGLSLFLSPPGLTVDLLRMIAAKADVHLYADNECVVYANGPFIALHATKSGEVNVNTGNESEIRDAVSGLKLGKGPILRIPMTQGETKILKKQ